MGSKSVFAVSLYLRFFFGTIDLHFLTFAINAEIFNSIGEIIIPLGISTKQAKVEMQIHTLAATAKVRKRSM